MEEGSSLGISCFTSKMRVVIWKVFFWFRNSISFCFNQMFINQQ